MLAPDHDQTPRPRSNIQPRRKGPPPSLRIDTPAQNPALSLVSGDSSSLSSANSESDFSPLFALPAKPKSMRNTKRLSLTLPSAHSNVSATSLTLVSDGESGHTTDASIQPSPANEPTRRASIASLPNYSMASRLHRKDEDDPSSTPYADGPVQIMPGIWLGSEDNARDWKGLAERGIRSILNVAREVNSPFDSITSRASHSHATPNSQNAGEAEGTLYPAHSGRPAMRYLKLHWSHGQPDLVKDGFVIAMTFVDSALRHGDNVLIHCQCGVSRSATVVIALVMRAAALSSPSAPPEVLALKGSGFSGAYDYVKEKSKCIGPNMLLIYQLQDYQQVLNGGNKSPSGSTRSSLVEDDEEEWSRRRRMLESDSDDADNDRESVEVREAHALDRAMEERIVSRKASSSSTGSSSGLGMGPAWKTRYGSRKRTGSVTSNFTSGSIISEDLVEEDEEEELLGIGRGFDAPSISTRSPSGETTEEEANISPDWKKDKLISSFHVYTPSTARPSFSSMQRPLSDADSLKLHLPPPSAPATKTSFSFTARLPFKAKSKVKHPALNSLPPVPASPDVSAPPEILTAPKLELFRRRTVPPPLQLNNNLASTRSSSRSSNLSHLSQTSVNTPSQTLFVFPASPTLRTQTPHMVTVTSNLNVPLSSSATPTPRVSTFKSDGRRRSFIGLMAPPTPTTACSRVDARGWIGLGSRGS